MTSFTFPARSLAARVPARLAGGPLTLCLVTACTAARTNVDAEESIRAALALPSAVVFRTEGGPIDVVTPTSDALPLAEALRLAVDASPEIQAALARVRAAQADADLAGALPNPILDLVLRFPEGGGKPEIEASLAADLVALLQRPRRASVAGHRLQAEAAGALTAALDVVAEVQTLYAGAQALEELARLFASRLVVSERLLAVARARLELGEGTRPELSALEAEHTELAAEAARHARELHLARLALAQRIGAPSSAAAWRLDAWQSPLAVPDEELRWTQAALAARPEVQAAEREVRARSEESALAGAGALGGATVGVDAERAEDWSVGPGVSTPLPVFDTGDARGRRARASEAEARHRLTEAQRTVVADVRAALAQLAGAQQDLSRITGELVPQAERRRNEVETAYGLGQLDVTALLLAEQALQAAQTRRVTLERELSLALVRLERAVGGPAVLAVTRTAHEQEVQP